MGRTEDVVGVGSRDRGANGGHPLREGEGKNRDRPAGAAALQGGLVGRGGGVVGALAGAVRIHRADPVRVRALVVGCPVLGALDNRLEGHPLQAHDEGKQDRENLRSS